MISEAEVERALDYLRDTAQKAAQARANALYLESYLKVVRSEEMSKQPELSAAAQERDALCSSAYKQTLTAYKEAVFEDNQYRFLRDAALAKLEAWRTECANNRGSV